jgi:protease IV
VRESMELVYDQFTQRVSVGRGSRLPDVGSVAEGRLFTGRQAVENGMADKLGGVALAMTDLADDLGLEQGDYDVIHLPPAMSFQTFLNDMIGARAPKVRAEASPLLATVKQILGPRAWPTVSATLQGLMLFQDEHILAIMPNAIIIR